MTLAQFTTKLKTLIRADFLHKKSTSPTFSTSYVPVIEETSTDKYYYPSTVTGSDLQKLDGISTGTHALPAGTTIAEAISTLSETNNLFRFGIKYRTDGNENIYFSDIGTTNYVCFIITSTGVYFGATVASNCFSVRWSSGERGDLGFFLVYKLQ